MSTSTVVASDLYREIRGEGPPVLMISGATGDAGHFSATAARLSDEFAVISYDRRGNSRSPRLGPGESMTIAAQADDAAALLRSLEISDTVVFGTSGGANIALELVSRHPRLVRGAIVHEPVLVALLPDPGAAMSELAPVFELAQRDPRAGAEAFLRANTSDATFDALAAELRERLLANGPHLFANELEAFVGYVPDVAALAASAVALRLLLSRDGLPFYAALVPWIEANLGLRPGYVSGHHAPYLQHPDVFAEELRPLLRELSR